jgi:hypothetical protein
MKGTWLVKEAGLALGDIFVSCSLAGSRGTLAWLVYLVCLVDLVHLVCFVA